MKKVLLMFLMALFFLPLFAPNSKRLIVATTRPINIYDKLMEAIIEVESKGDSLAFNPVEQAYGIMQIRPIRLLDYNQRTGKKYKMKDCFKPSVSREIFLYYAKQIGTTSRDYETIAKRWNGSGVKTIEYWDKVKVEL